MKRTPFYRRPGRAGQFSGLRERVIWMIQTRGRPVTGSEIADLVCRAHRSKERLEQQVRDNDERLKNLRQESEEEMQRRRKRREESEERLTDAQQGLAKALGLDPNVPMYVLTRTLWEAMRRLTEDEEIKRLRGILSNLERTLNDGLKPLPGEKAA